MRSKTLEIRQVPTSFVPCRSILLTRLGPSSWHGTSPIFAADYQPWSAAQLRKVLPFPNPGVASSSTLEPSTSNSGSGPIPGLPSTPSRKQEDVEVGGTSTPIASSSSSSNAGVLGSGLGVGEVTPTATRTSFVPGLDATPTQAASTSASNTTGGFNASAARVYRLATAGADSCVRVSDPPAVRPGCVSSRQPDRPCVLLFCRTCSDLDGPPQRDGRTQYQRCDGTRSRSSSTSSGVRCVSQETHWCGQCGQVEPERSIPSFGR